MEKKKKKAAKHCNYSDISNKLEQFSSPWTRPKRPLQKCTQKPDDE